MPCTHPAHSGLIVKICFGTEIEGEHRLYVNTKAGLEELYSILLDSGSTDNQLPDDFAAMGPVYVVVISVQLDLPKLDVRLRTGEIGHGPIPP